VSGCGRGWAELNPQRLAWRRQGEAGAGENVGGGGTALGGDFDAQA
jgi:hypothetical protein